MLCSACIGYGSWVFWGRREACPVCGGAGVEGGERYDLFCPKCRHEWVEYSAEGDWLCPKCGTEGELA